MFMGLDVFAQGSSVRSSKCSFEVSNSPPVCTATLVRAWRNI